MVGSSSAAGVSTGAFGGLVELTNCPPSKMPPNTQVWPEGQSVLAEHEVVIVPLQCPLQVMTPDAFSTQFRGVALAPLLAQSNDAPGRLSNPRLALWSSSRNPVTPGLHTLAGATLPRASASTGETRMTSRLCPRLLTPNRIVYSFPSA